MGQASVTDYEAPKFNDYEAPKLTVLGTLASLTLENYPANGQDLLSFLNPDFGSYS